jgi:hypothetical protein
MSVVTFDPANFKIRYPIFADITDASLTLCFNEASLYLSNADNSPVADLTRRELLLWMLTAHIATLGGLLNDNSPQNFGPIASATEGSVSVSFNNGSQPGTAAWFQQTQYGASFWQATIGLRSFRWRAQPTRY